MNARRGGSLCVAVCATALNGADALGQFFYQAKDPIVMGLGFVAMRDAILFLRDFLYQGFNEDVCGRIVFDGIDPDVADSP